MIKTYAKALEFDRRFPHRAVIMQPAPPTLGEFHAADAAKMRAAAKLARSVIRELDK